MASMNSLQKTQLLLINIEEVKKMLVPDNAARRCYVYNTVLSYNGNMSDESSSSDDENERFKEATDADFLTDDLYKKNRRHDEVSSLAVLPLSSHARKIQYNNDYVTAGNEEKTNVTKLEVLPSKRNQECKKVESNNPYAVKVTPEFQKYVSRHLSKILDESIEDNKKVWKKLKKSEVVGGVRLLKGSKNYLLPYETFPSDNLIKKKRKSHKNSYSDDIEMKAKEVAVSGEWVLSQEETKHWVPNKKSVVEVIKVEK